MNRHSHLPLSLPPKANLAERRRGLFYAPWVGFTSTELQMYNFERGRKTPSPPPPPWLVSPALNFEHATLREAVKPRALPRPLGFTSTELRMYNFAKLQHANIMIEDNAQCVKYNAKQTHTGPRVAEFFFCIG